MRAVDDRARGQEQQALEDGVVQRVQQRDDQSHRRERAVSVAAHQERETQSDEDQAEVLDRAVGEHALEMRLGNRIRAPRSAP